MSFSEPITVVVNAISKLLARVSVGDRTALYTSAADGLEFRISHANAKRDRLTVRLDATKTAADPLLDGVSRQYSMSTYLVADRPKVGFSLVEQQQYIAALVDWLDVPANLAKVVGGES